MTEKLDLEAIEARCEALDERMGKTAWTLEGPDRYGLFSVYDGDGLVIYYGVEEEQLFIAHARADVPALVAEVKRLRASLKTVLEEATSDLDRDIIITECQSALAAQTTDETYNIRLHRVLREDYEQPFHES